MALLRGPYGTTQIKGSIGATTFQQSPSGLIARTRTHPVNPATPRQEAARQSFNDASAMWLLLFPSLRDEWTQYAANTPWLNGIGDSIFLKDRQHFMRVVTFQLNTTKTIATVITSGDLIYGIPPAIAPTMTADVADGIVITAMPTVYTAVPFIHQFRYTLPFITARSFFKGPYLFSLPIIQSDGLPIELFAAADVEEGQVMFFANATYYEGKGLSTVTFGQIRVGPDPGP